MPPCPLRRRPDPLRRSMHHARGPQKRYVSIVRFGMIVASQNKGSSVCSVAFGCLIRNGSIEVNAPFRPYGRVRNNVRFGREGRYDVVSTALSPFPPSSGMSELGGFRRHRFLGKSPAATWQYARTDTTWRAHLESLIQQLRARIWSTGTDREKTNL